MIHIEHVSKRFGRRLALDDVSMRILPGEITLLLGANGAGKSTLLRSILGITGFAGRIRVNGIDPLDDGATVRSLIGYMPQTGGLHADLTVEQTLQFHAAIRQVPHARALALAEEAGLSPHMNDKVGDLSGGMRQRLGFALALLTDPPILLLDEPSASLDAASRQWVAGRLRALAESGRVVLVSTHAGQELLAPGDRRIVLEEGRVADGIAVGLVGTPPESRPAGSGLPAVQPARVSVLPIARKELHDAIRNRWMAAYAVVLGALGLAAAASGLESSAGLALQTFGRTTATLMNLCLLLAPLVAVLTGAATIAGENDRGTLENLLAQPMTRGRLLLAKYGGLLASLTLATAAGFVPAGLFVAAHTGTAFVGQFLLFPAIAAVLGAAMLGIGLLISVSSRGGVQAQGTAVLVWFTFVLLYDLLLMGTLALSGLSVGGLAITLIANPVDAARVLGLLALEPDLYLLGPAGAYITARLGVAGAALVLSASLGVWTAAPLAASIWRFRSVSRRPGAGVRLRRSGHAGRPRVKCSSTPPVSIIKSEEVRSS
jgi:Cu-processing system permease protein